MFAELAITNFSSITSSELGLKKLYAEMADCIVHYDSIDTSGDKLVRPSPNTFETLLECKKIRESLGSENHYVDQCNKIPENLGEIEYFYHRKCFQKFVYAKALLKRKASKDNDQGCSSKLQRTTRKASQSAVATSSRGLFPQPRSRGFRMRTRGETGNHWSGPVT